MIFQLIKYSLEIQTATTGLVRLKLKVPRQKWFCNCRLLTASEEFNELVEEKVDAHCKRS